MTKLFKPLRVGRVELSNRIALAPLTRFRADDNHVPMPFVKDYYAQRGSVAGTLLITEGTLISPRAGGCFNVPGIYTEAQIAAWKEVTDTVHAKGSFIYMQIYAVGRVANLDALKAAGGGSTPYSSSPTPLDADSPVPHELTESEIHEFIKEHVQAARNAIAAGFDGVEVHGANGYLMDQFIQENCNTRTDAWGGSVERRAKFAIDTTRAVAEAIGADRTGIRLSPWSLFQGMRMADPKPQFEYLARQMAALRLAYVHLVESRVSGNADVDQDDRLDFFMRAYGDASPVIFTGGYQADSAVQAVDVKYADFDAIIGIGRSFISNPDLPFRVKQGLPFAPCQRDTFYTPMDPKGYIDSEFSAEFKKSVEAAA